MTPKERYEFCDQALADGHFNIHYSELDLPDPEGPKYDDQGICTNRPTNTSSIVTRLRFALSCDWSVMPVNQDYFDASEEPVGIDEASQYLARALTPAVGIHLCNRSLRPDWLWARYMESTGEQAGSRFASGLDTVGAAFQRRETPAALAHDAAATMMRAAQAVSPGSGKLIQQTENTMRRLR